MKKITKIFAFAIVMISFSLTSNAQVSVSAGSSATIVTPISMVKNVDLAFGNVAVTDSAGTVQLAATVAGTRTPVGGVTLPATTGTFTAAKFTVSGQSGYTYAITLPASVTLTSGVNTMTVDNIVSTPNATGTLTGGTEVLYVGATLNVSAGQAAGSYTNAADLSVTVNYN